MPMIPIIYLTGVTCSGKGTLGKMLADKYNLSHFSIGDTRRDFLEQFNADKIRSSGSSSMSAKINRYITDGKEIPGPLLDHVYLGTGSGDNRDGRVKRVPAILHYYNFCVSSEPKNRIVPYIIREKIAEAEEAQAQAQETTAATGGKAGIRAILIDGFPVTTTSWRDEETVAEFADRFSGLTILLECPPEVAQKRYKARGRRDGGEDGPDGNGWVERFQDRMRKTETALPAFVEFMKKGGGREGGGGVVVTLVNDGSKTVEDTFEELERKLMGCEIFRNIVS